MKFKSYHIPKIVILLVAVVFISGCIQEKVEVDYKGVWMPTLDYSLLHDTYDGQWIKPIFLDLDKAMESGIDTLAFSPVYWADEEGEISLLPGVKEPLVSFIENAKARGFKIWLVLEIVYPEEGAKRPTRVIPDELIENTDLMKNFDSAVIEWAKFAQEHDIEIFSPINEGDLNFGWERNKNWLVEIKPKIEAVYSGKICAKGEWPIPKLSSSYSCFGPTIEIPKNEEEKNNLINQIEEAKKQDIEFMMGEIFEGEEWQGTVEDTKRGFAMAVEAGKGRANGFFILDVPRLTSFDENLESMIKELYLELE